MNKTIDNARTTRDAALTIDATNVSALFFTGYCDAAYTGNNYEGVVHIKGGSKTVDVYINDLQIYALDNKTSNITVDAEGLQSATANGSNYYAKNKGSVFVYSSTSTTSPFTIKMHIRETNILDAAIGATYSIAAEKDGYNGGSTEGLTPGESFPVTKS